MQKMYYNLLWGFLALAPAALVTFDMLARVRKIVVA
jgi:hypothetical protein